MIFTKTQMQRWTHWLRLSASPPETSICISYLKGLSQGLESHVAFVEYLLDVFRKVKQRLVGLRYLLSLRGLGGCPHCAQNAFKQSLRRAATCAQKKGTPLICGSETAWNWLAPNFQKRQRTTCESRPPCPFQDYRSTGICGIRARAM